MLAAATSWLEKSAAAGLLPGQALEPEEIDRLKRESREEDAYARCLALVGRRPRSRAEIERYLHGRKLADSEAGAVLAEEGAAEEELSRIASDIAARWQIQDVALCRRTGRLKLGELILAAAVSAAHRREAFEACQYAVERLKAMKSIAKREIWQEET